MTTRPVKEWHCYKMAYDIWGEEMEWRPWFASDSYEWICAEAKADSLQENSVAVYGVLHRDALVTEIFDSLYAGGIQYIQAKERAGDST